MKWFKHISDSLDDPFIFSLMEEFGHTGYAIFFGVLEIYAREFSVKDDWKLTEKLSYFRHKLRISRSKFKKVLSKIDKWEIEFNGEYVSIFIPKFKELMDESTLKKLRAGEKSFRNHSGILPKSDTTDVDVEEDVDKEEDKDLKPIVEKPEIPFKEIIEYLNLKADKRYQHTTPKTQGFIRTRWNEGFKSLDDYKHVIDVKCHKWLNTEDEKFLRPETLFGTKFEGYLNERIIINSQSPQVPKATTVYQADMLQKEAVNQEYLRQRRQEEDEKSNCGPQDVVDIENSPKAIS